MTRLCWMVLRLARIWLSTANNATIFRQLGVMVPCCNLHLAEGTTMGSGLVAHGIQWWGHKDIDATVEAGLLPQLHRCFITAGGGQYTSSGWLVPEPSATVGFQECPPFLRICSTICPPVLFLVLGLVQGPNEVAKNLFSLHAPSSTLCAFHTNYFRVVYRS